MRESGFDQYYDEAVEPGKRERAYAWATAIGLQDVDGLKPSNHLLATARCHIEGEITQEEVKDVTNDLFARESWYFRNALVRANYENAQLNVVKTTAYLEDFLKVLLFGEEIELENRFLRIGFEYGSANAAKVADLHRRKDGMGGNAGGNMGGNQLSSLPLQQQEVCRLMLKNPLISAVQIAELQKVRVNMVEKRIAVLRKKRRHSARRWNPRHLEGSLSFVIK